MPVTRTTGFEIKRPYFKTGEEAQADNARICHPRSVSPGPHRGRLRKLEGAKEDPGVAHRPRCELLLQGNSAANENLL